MRIQDKLKTLGENGCYIISFTMGMNANASSNEMIEVFDNLLSKGIINTVCWVLDNNNLASEYGYTYEYKNKISDEDLGYFDIIIKEYYNPRTKFQHFVLFRDGKDCDSLEKSVTVSEGYVRSYRCFKHKGSSQ